MARLHFCQRVRFEPIDEVVGLYAQPFTAAHFDVGPLSILFR